MSAEGETVDTDEISKKPIPKNELWEALNKTLDVFGPSLKEATITELEKNGIELASGTASKEYTLQELKDKLKIIFGDDGTEVILEQLVKHLASRKSGVS
ncbi:MAG: hypothetical protein ACRD5H_02075 [Nitrososphaerales archaeon]